MKLLSLNVALFEKNNPKLEAFIRSVNPDILAMQEVTRKLDASIQDELISKTAIDVASVDLSYSFYAPVWVLSGFDKKDFHGHEHFVFDMGGKAEFGNYVLSRYEITGGLNVFVQNSFEYKVDWSLWPDDESRAVEVVDLDVDGKQLRILNYHGIWSKNKIGNAKTKRACEIIKSKAMEVDYPVILCGDFNLFPDTESMKVFEPELESLVDTFEIKTTRPGTNELSDKERNVVDYIWVKGIKVNGFEVLDSDVSDHLPLVLDFDFK